MKIVLNIALFGNSRHKEDEIFLLDLWNRLKEEEEKGFFKIYLHRSLAYLGTSAIFDAVLPENTNILLSLGGDGTLLDTLPLVGSSGVKVMGVNMGTLGFLSGADRNEIQELVEGLKQNKYIEEKRGILELVSNQEGLMQGNNTNLKYAMNELVVFKSDTSSLISVKVKVNGQLLNKYYGDGVIFATSTGSTAYSLSCGGPIIVPEMESMLITPIASHTLTVRPMLLPLSSSLEVEVEDNIEFKISADSNIATVRGPFKFNVQKADFSLSTLRLPKHDFFSTLRQKLMWGADGRRQQE